MSEWIVTPKKRDLGASKRTVLGGLSQGLEGIQSLGGVDKSKIEKAIASYGNKLGDPINFKPVRSSELLRNAFGVTEEDIAPQGFLENIGQRFVGSLPFMAAGGGLGALRSSIGRNLAGPFTAAGGGLGALHSSIGRNLAGSGVGAALEELGASPLIQTFGQAGTEFALGIKSNNRKSAQSSSNKTSPGNFGPSGLDVHKEKLYGKSEASLSPHEKGSATNLSKAIDSIKNDLTLNTSERNRKIIEDATRTAESIIDPSGRIDILEARRVTKNLNDQIYDKINTPKSAKPELSKIKGGILKDFEQHGQANPAFWENLDKANRIHEVQSANKVISDRISTHPWYSTYRIIKDGLKKIKANFNYLHVAPVREYYAKLIGATLKDSVKDMAKYAIKFGKEVDKTPEPQEEIQWKITPRNG